MECLKSHVDTAVKGYEEAAEQMETPVSTIDVQKTISWLETSKARLQPIDVDVKDAKRRISAAKGPKKKRRAAQGSAGEESTDGEVSG